MNKTYYELYLKYKNKYLLKKSQIGSSLVKRNKYFIPCEITNFTKKILISNCRTRDRLANFLSNELHISGIQRIKSSTGFLQDPYIILNNSQNNNFLIRVFGDCNISDIQEIDIENNRLNFNGNHYGGNYISSPNKKIFTFDKSVELINCISRILSDEIVPLDCSFKINNERHIDEIMCFMPYGKDKYKVWFYYIRNITFHSDTLTLIENLDNINKDQFKNKIIRLRDNFNVPQEKKTRFGTNKTSYIELSNELDNLINFIEDKISITQLNLELLLDTRILSKLDNIQMLYYKNLIGDNQIPDLENIKTILNEERERNLQLISDKLFTSSYEDARGNFVFFPIDLKVKYNNRLNYNITNIPIFNRLIIENAKKKLCILSIGTNTDTEVIEKLNEEKPKIKSFIDDKVFEFHTFDTTQYNNEGDVGGNLHCLVKNIY